MYNRVCYFFIKMDELCVENNDWEKGLKVIVMDLMLCCGSSLRVNNVRKLKCVCVEYHCTILNRP